MLARDIEMFIEHCGLKGLSTKTINSYEQTLRLFMQYMDEQGILLTEKITHLAIQGYIKSIKERGKYTVTTNPNSGNYPDRRVDFGKRVSDVTINNYLRNLRVFFNWCVEEELILRSPVKKGDFVKVERKPLEFVSDEDFKRLLKSMNSASFSEYRDSIIIQLLLDTGMRVNECLLIEVTDLDMVKRCISLPADKLSLLTPSSMRLLVISRKNGVLPLSQTRILRLKYRLRVWTIRRTRKKSRRLPLLRCSVHAILLVQAAARQRLRSQIVNGKQFKLVQSLIPS